jgi:hypothetical protein
LRYPTSSASNRGWFIENAGKSKICDAENASIINEKIRGCSIASD